MSAHDHDHDHHTDLNNIVADKALSAFVSQFKTGPLGKLITSKVMENIADAVKKIGQQLEGPIFLNESLTPPVRFEDGTALFLFDRHREHVSQKLILVTFDQASIEREAMSVVCLSVNEKDLASSEIYTWHPIQVQEIYRQLAFVGNLGKTRLYSSVFLAKENLPDDYAFYVPPESGSEPEPVVEPVGDSIVEQSLAVESAAVAEEAITPAPVADFVNGRRVMPPQTQALFDSLKAMAQVKPNARTQEAEEVPFLDIPAPVVMEEAQVTLSEEQENWARTFEIVRVLRVNPNLDLLTEDGYRLACARGFVGNQDAWIKKAKPVISGLNELSQTQAQAQSLSPADEDEDEGEGDINNDGFISESELQEVQKEQADELSATIVPSQPTLVV
jgi:hypothetical protein